MRPRHFVGSLCSLAILALVGCLLGLKADVVQAQTPKARPPLPISGPVSADLLRLLERQPQAVGSLAGVTADAMQWSGDRVGVTVTATDPEALVPALKQLGMQKIIVSQEHHLLEGMIPPRSLAQLDGLKRAGLLGVDPMLRPWVHVGAVTSQADFTHEAVRARATPPGPTGAGVKIGVISDSFNSLGGAAADQASGDLPVVQIIQDDGTTDEGRGMCQLVHDLAPGSPLAFATANGGEANFANNIRRLANPAEGNCDIIVDDVIYFAEPAFQDGIVAQAADEVVTQRGVAYFSSAGNQANAGWESNNPNAGTDPGVAGSFVDFDPGAGVDRRQRITFPANRTIRLIYQWDDPFYTAGGVDTDLGILFLTPGTNNIVATIDGNNITSQRPLEIVQASGGSTGQQFDMMIRITSGPAPKRIKILTFGGAPTLEFATNSGTIYGHAAAKNAMAVGASPYFDQRNLESFSSFGPCTILFQPNGTALGSAEVRPKPNFTAIDGCNTTFFGQDTEGDGFPNFFGTSASAPHAAALAALIRQANTGFTPKDVYDALIDTATDMGSPGVDNQSGAGMVNVYDALFSPIGPGNLPLTDGFEDGALSRSWETSSNGAGRVFVTNANGPAVGSLHAAMDSQFNHMASLNEMILHLNTQANQTITLAYRQKEFNDADQAMPATFSGSSNTDGVAMSVNGNQWVRIVSLTGGDSTNSYRDVTFNLSQLAQAAGLTIGSKLLIKFQQFGDQTLGSGGMVFDDIRVSGASADGADLLFLKFEPKVRVRAGKTSIIGSVTVQNAGNKKSKPCKIAYFLSADNVLNTNTDLALTPAGVQKLNPRNSQKLKLKLKVPSGTNPVGQHLFAVVDADNKNAETNESNNVVHAGPFP